MNTAIRRALHLCPGIFAALLGAWLLLAPLPATAAMPTLAAALPQDDDVEGSVLESYIGNTEAYFDVWIRNRFPAQDRVRGDLLQGGRLVARYTAASQMNAWEYHATGLTPGSSVTFNLVLYLWDRNEEKWQELKRSSNTIVAGEIWGVVKRDTIWRGGTWNLHGTVWVQDGARLTIDDGAVVTLDPAASPWDDGTLLLDHPDAALEVENATLRDQHINVGSPDGGVSPYPAAIAIRNSTLEDTSVGGYSGAYWFCVPRLVLENNRGSATPHESWAPAIRVCSDAPGALTLRGNILPGYDAVLNLGSATGELVVADNTLRHVEFGSGFADTNPIQVSLTLRNNTLETLEIRRQRAPLLVEGNTIGAAIFERSFADTATGAAADTIQGIVRNNTFTPAGYATKGIELAGAWWMQVESNAIACQHTAQREFGVHVTPYLPLEGAPVAAGNNVIAGNTIRNCDVGIDLYGYTLPMANNTVRDNVLIDNNSSMWVSWLAQHNLIYNNLFRQAPGQYPNPLNIWIHSASCQDAQGQASNCPNTWHIAKTAGTNIVGGPFLGGNYYSEYNGSDVDQDWLGDQPYPLAANNQDQHSLISIHAPDLFVAPLMLDAGRITFDAGRYILPVDAVITNLGDQPASALQIRWWDGSGWQQSSAIGGLAAGASTVAHLDWELNPTLMPGNGQAQAVLNLQADPTNAIVEILETNNLRAATLPLDLRPRLLAVEPEYLLAGAYYLNHTAVANRLAVLVDWNGALPGGGNAPFGAVVFNLNGNLVTEAGADWGAAHTYDLGSDFIASLQCANNLLRLSVRLPIAGGELQSLETTLQPTVFPFPGWVAWAITHLPNADTAFTTRLAAPVVEYQYDFRYPAEPFAATWTPPAWIPYVGGAELGIQPTQGGFDVMGQSSGQGTVAAEGQTGLGLAALTAVGRIFGQGETRFVCGESLDVPRAELGLEISMEVAKEIGLTDLIPATRAAENWPVVGRIIRWVNSVAMVRGSLTPAVTIVTQFAAQNDALAFQAGEGTGRIAARAELAVAPVEDLNASVYGGGEPYVTVQVPAAPGYLKEVGINLFYGATFQAWSFETATEHRINCQFPGACTEAELQQAASAWRLIPRRTIGPAYARFAALPVQTAAAEVTTTLLTNIYPYPQPALAVQGGNRWLAYVHDDPADPEGRGAEIALLTYSGAAWNAPVAITADTQPDYAPAVAVDGSGRSVIIWEHAALADGVTPVLDIAFAQSLEIHACAWNGSVCIAPTALSNNALMDYAPQLAPLADGNLLALWQSSDGTDLLGTAAHPVTLYTAVWNHATATWSAPQVALAGLYDLLGVAFAAQTSSQAAVMLARDMDGDLLTPADSELFYSTFDGATWSAPVRLTNDAVADEAPRLAYDAAGRRQLVWRRNGALVWLNNTWAIGAVQTLGAATEGGALGSALVRATNGNLALVWTTLDAAGPALAYRVFDATANAWSARQLLLADGAAEAAYATAFAADGALNLALQRTQLTYADAGGAVNIPTPGQHDLIFLVHTVGRDLMWESLTVTPAQPTPGGAVLLTGVLRNAGDLTVAAPQAVFYADDAAIAAVQTLPALAAGYTTTVDVAWTLPATATLPYVLAAVADPAGQVAETDETNNQATAGVNLPNLSVDAFYTTAADGQLTAVARMRNAGGGAALTPFTVTLRAGAAITGALLAERAASSLSAGDLVTLTFLLTDTAGLTDVNALWVLADAAEAVAESRETDNAAVAMAGLLPDLTLTAADLVIGETTTITVHNRGLRAATNVLVTVAEGALDGAQLYSSVVASLPAGGGATVAFSLSAGGHTLFAAVDPLHAIGERDESNNVAVRSATVQIVRSIYLPIVRR